ncbi:MAG: cytochrome ubiquinol oxidase subunit I [Planctomycetota bacterium]
MNVELLSRFQFAFTVAFHYLFPPLSIGLGLILVVMEAMWLRTRDEAYLAMTKFWMKIFGLIFAIGVASGIVMEFQFGTNWAAYSRYVGDVFGSALAAEGIFAFFLESGFLAIALFGWDVVRPGWHFFSTCMVCLGAHFSAVWIIVANSWQQTPAGHHVVEMPGGGYRAEVVDFWQVIFNPSTVDRLTHTVLGAYLAAAFMVASVSAFYLLMGRHRKAATTGLKISLIVAALASAAQLLSGHASAQGVVVNQPAKLAAFEGLFQTQKRAPLHVFGWVDERNEQVQGLAIPGGLSFLAHNDFNAEVTGLDQFEPEDRPPVNLTFQFFHIMVACGVAMIGISGLGLLFWWRGWLFEAEGRITRLYLWLLVFAVLLPQLANQMGWFTAEVGRQPWIVYGLLRTSEGLSESVDAQQVLFSLILFGLIYALLFALFVYLLDHKIRTGPAPHEEPEPSAKRHAPFKTEET